MPSRERSGLGRPCVPCDRCVRGWAGDGRVRLRASRSGRHGTSWLDPRDLLKLYLCGYLHQLRSSRRLEAVCRRNVELMSLLGRLYPDHKSIVEFRRLHRDAVTAAGVEAGPLRAFVRPDPGRVDRHRRVEVPRRGQRRQRTRARSPAPLSGQHGERRRRAADHHRSIRGCRPRSRSCGSTLNRRPASCPSPRPRLRPIRCRPPSTPNMGGFDEGRGLLCAGAARLGAAA
jgi:hypothetical protein